MTDDLSPGAVADALPGRPVRAYPALLSTEADALAWARAGGPSGAVVVAGYQASPRGRAGLPWEAPPGRSLTFSLVLRPDLHPTREGWLYTVAVSGLADAVAEVQGGGEATIEWPDRVRLGGEDLAAVAVQSGVGPERVEWAVVTVLVREAEPPRPPLMARVVERIEARLAAPAEGVLADYRRRCETLGRRIRARLIPLGPSGPQVTGRAVAAITDGALVVASDDGRRLAVRPQSLGLLEEASEED